MTPEEKSQLEELVQFKRNLENASTIPLLVDYAIRERFRTPIIAKKTLNFAGTLAQASSQLTVEIPQAKVGDAVIVTPPVAAIVGNLGSIFVGYVSTTGVVTIRFINPDATNTLDPLIGEFTIIIIKAQ